MTRPRILLLFSAILLRAREKLGKEKIRTNKNDRRASARRLQWQIKAMSGSYA
jgi:hypothetical protein